MSRAAPTQTPTPPAVKSTMTRILESDLLYSYRKSPLIMIAGTITAILVLAALLAPLISPHNPYDLKSLSLLDSNVPPRWIKDGDARFLLGTDDQGRDIFSTILFGLRSSLLISICAVTLALVMGVSLGLIAGYFGGAIDGLIMRVADVQLTFPALLSALIVDGIAKVAFKGSAIGDSHFLILVISIGLSYWVQYARTVRGVTLVEKNKEYVQAARLIGLSKYAIMFKHVLPNVLSPVLVIATINLALAIITEATLSFLGVGLPPTEPSLGTMIQIGNKYLFSGSWWMVAFPGLTLAILVLAVNLVGDWLRDALNPRLR
ncbi:MAG: ABC transporter permease [Hyphomicrobiaceae bacterium]